MIGAPGCCVAWAEGFVPKVFGIDSTIELCAGRSCRARQYLLAVRCGRATLSGGPAGLRLFGLGAAYRVLGFSTTTGVPPYGPTLAGCATLPMVLVGQA